MTTAAMAASARGSARLLQAESPVTGCEPNLGENTRPWSCLRAVVRVRAPNPSALTLDGTNSYVVSRWVVDPGPAIPSHVAALRDAADGGIEGVVLTHSHADHAEAADEFGVPVVLPADGAVCGPFTAVATPGHSADSVCLLFGRVCFTGDTVLGRGERLHRPGRGLAVRLPGLAAPPARTGPRSPVPGPRPGGLGPRGKARRVHRASPGPRTPAPRGAGGGPSHRRRAADRSVAGGPGGAATRGGADAGGAHGEA